MFLSFQTGLPKEQSHQGLHCLHFSQHLLDLLLDCKTILFNFSGNYSNFSCVQNFTIFTISILTTSWTLTGTPWLARIYVYTLGLSTYRCKSVPPFWSRKLSTILTHLAYIANGKKSCSILQEFTGWKCVTFFGAILWRHPSHQPCLLDVRWCNVTSFLRFINIIYTCERLCYSLTFGRISSVQWWKVRRIWKIRLPFHCLCLLCVRIEID